MNRPTKQQHYERQCHVLRVVGNRWMTAEDLAAAAGVNTDAIFLMARRDLLKTKMHPKKPRLKLYAFAKLPTPPELVSEEDKLAKKWEREKRYRAKIEPVNVKKTNPPPERKTAQGRIIKLIDHRHPEPALSVGANPGRGMSSLAMVLAL